MAGSRVNRRVVAVLTLVVIALLLSQLFKYGPVSRSAQNKNKDPKSVPEDEMNSGLQKSTDKIPQTDDFILNSDHQIQVLDTPRQMLKDSENVPDLLHWENPLESKETQLKNQSQSTKAISHSSHPSDDSDAIRLYQTSKKTDQRYNSQISSKVLPVYHRFNASSVLNHFSSISKFNKSKAIGSNPHPGGQVDHTTNIKPLQQVLADHTKMNGRAKDSCSSFYEQVSNPTFQPIPVCGSKDYPMHTVHCYQSSMNIAPYQASRSLNETIIKGGEVNIGMGVTCTFQNIAVNGQNVMESLRDCARNCDVRSSKSLFLLEGKLSQCPIPTISLLMNKTDQYDYTRNFVQEILMLNKEKHLDPSQCGQWVNKTAVFFIANEPYNVYFQFLTYYNVFLTMNLLSSTKEVVFRGLTSFRSDPQDLVLVRLSDATDYKFRDFERKLFPQLSVLSHLGNVANNSGSIGKDSDITCFQKVVKVPWAYSALPFRSVVDSRLKNETLRCYNTVRNPARIDSQPKQKHGINEHINMLSKQVQTGIDQPEQSIKFRDIKFARIRSQTATVVPSMITFRSLVLKACGIEERVAQDNNLKSSVMKNKVVIRQKFPLQAVVIQRKPYLRHGLDHPNLFQRMLSNEAELLTVLTRNISRDLLNVKSVYMEELDVCDQVKVAHNADILIGVHGAGLVHSWWMREGRVLLELVPLTKLDHPTYKVLAGLTGRKYYSVILKKSPQKHHSSVSISAVLKLLARITKEWTVGT